MKRFRDYILDDNGKPISGVTVTVRKSAPPGSVRKSGQPGQPGTKSGPGSGGAAGGPNADMGASGGDWGEPGADTSTVSKGGAAGFAVRLKNGATVTWVGGNTSAKVKGGVGA